LKGIQVQLYQIKLPLLTLILSCLLGFYGISRAMWDDVAMTVTQVCEALMVIAFLEVPAMLVIWMRALGSLWRAARPMEPPMNADRLAWDVVLAGD
jgi:hypothetical protein